LEQEHDNLRAALGWLREEGKAEQGLRLAGALGRFWWFKGYFREGRSQLGELLELAGAASGRTAARAKALHNLGVLIYRSADYSTGDQQAARSCLEESVEDYRELGDAPRATAALMELGYLSAEAGDWQMARSSLEESLRLGRQWGDEHGIALTRSYLGIMAVLRGEHDSARAHLEESLGVLRRVGALPEVKVCSFLSGVARLRRGRLRHSLRPVCGDGGGCSPAAVLPLRRPLGVAGLRTSRCWERASCARPTVGGGGGRAAPVPRPICRTRL
jgi:tetratricopeptide (TPR) repeat protein